MSDFDPQSKTEYEEDFDKVQVVVPKAAFVETPPNFSSPTYRHFKSTQPLTSGDLLRKRKSDLFGEMPLRGNPVNTQHYQHKYHSPPSPVKKRVSENTNTPRFTDRVASPRPGPDQYYPFLGATGPSYSFGHKLGERSTEHTYGKGRTSWEKAWFASSDVWKVKTNFENKWPEIGSHEYELNCMGKKLPHLRCGPSPSFGAKLSDLSVRRRQFEPSPNAYNTSLSAKHMYKASPSYTIVRKDYTQEPWIKNKHVPGPGKYAPNITAVKPRKPAFSFAKPPVNYTQFCC